MVYGNIGVRPPARHPNRLWNPPSLRYIAYCVMFAEVKAAGAWSWPLGGWIDGIVGIVRSRIQATEFSFSKYSTSYFVWSFHLRGLDLLEIVNSKQENFYLMPGVAEENKYTPQDSWHLFRNSNFGTLMPGVAEENQYTSRQLAFVPEFQFWDTHAWSGWGKSVHSSRQLAFLREFLLGHSCLEWLRKLSTLLKTTCICSAIPILGHSCLEWLRKISTLLKTSGICSGIPILGHSEHEPASLTYFNLGCLHPVT
jgi:hypothetical protein